MKLGHLSGFLCYPLKRTIDFSQQSFCQYYCNFWLNRRLRVKYLTNFELFLEIYRARGRHESNTDYILNYCQS